MSEKVREMIFENIKLEKVKIKKHKKIALSQAEALMKWASKPVSGPGNSEYDKYAYDF
ncbi:MAG: hypothetical protein Q8Q30_02880 [Candidatus Woesebacteria bacterium]|nr:hypothetical protein [Candidatus Woesebacteria bacterium]